MKFYNMMTSTGFSQIMGVQFFMCWIGLALLVLIGLVCKKWLGEEEAFSIPYNWIGSLLGAVVYVVIVTVSGSAKWSLVAGLVGMFVGGFGGATVLGGTE